MQGNTNNLYCLITQFNIPASLSMQKIESTNSRLLILTACYIYDNNVASKGQKSKSTLYIMGLHFYLYISTADENLCLCRRSDLKSIP